MSAQNPRPTRAYCGAPPPEGRTTATCILAPGHAPHDHRNLDGLRWPVSQEG